MPNLFEPDFDAERDEPPFRWRRARLGRQAGARELGGRRLEPGEIVACPAGRDGAHRLDNHGDEPARVLIVSTMKAPEINEMVESGTFWVRDYAPGLTPEEPGLDLPGLRPSED